MNEELQERYIYAVVRRLPRKQREDIEQELRGLIADMLEARCRGLPPTEHDLRVVLAELGTPRELYRKYSPDAGEVSSGRPIMPGIGRCCALYSAARPWG